MSKGYVLTWERTTAKTLGDRKAHEFGDVIPKVRNRLSKRRGKGYRIAREGQELSRVRNLGETMDRLRDILPNMKVGELTRVRSVATGDVLRIYCVQTDGHKHGKLPSGAKGFWHPKVQHIYKVVFGMTWEHGVPQFWGAYNCRLVRGSSSTWSMHSNWPPVLAIDIGCASKALGDEIVAYVKEHIDGVVTYWWGQGAGGHFDHAHFQIGPGRAGRPACA